MPLPSFSQFSAVNPCIIVGPYYYTHGVHKSRCKQSCCCCFFTYYRQPEFCNWAFNLPRGLPCKEKWDLIPEGTDVLITHGPPLGHGDMVQGGRRSGCLQLWHAVQRVRPKYHVFGHIHEGEECAARDSTEKDALSIEIVISHSPFQTRSSHHFFLPLPSL